MKQFSIFLILFLIFGLEFPPLNQVALAHISAARLRIQTGQSKPHPCAYFPQKIYSEVFGSPALASTVSGAVKSAILTKLKVAPNSVVTYQTGKITSIEPFHSEIITADVTVSPGQPVFTTDSPADPNLIPSYGQVKILVKNIGQLLPRESQLWFSNVPENIKREQAIYSNILSSGESVRILYHHVCFNANPLYLRILLVNESDKTAKVQIVSGDARPTKNPAEAGLEAAEKYLPSRISQSGEFITLPPHTQVPIALREMVFGTVMSGLSSVSLLPGGPRSVMVKVDSVLFVAPNVSLQRALIDGKPWHDINPFMTSDPGVLSENHLSYSSPTDTISLNIRTNGPIVKSLIGVEGIPRIGGGRNLNGNYGVLYHYRLHISNPESKSVFMKAIFTATTPYTCGMFCLDSENPSPIPPMNLHRQRSIFKWKLAPNQKKDVEFWAITCSGATYPAQISFESFTHP